MLRAQVHQPLQCEQIGETVFFLFRNELLALPTPQLARFNFEKTTDFSPGVRTTRFSFRRRRRMVRVGSQHTAIIASAVPSLLCIVDNA